jgi:hypothetical protein
MKALTSRACMVSVALGTTRLCALAEGTIALPKTASQQRTLREIVNRISTLTDDELALLVETDDRTEQQALLWLATCRAYQWRATPYRRGGVTIWPEPRRRSSSFKQPHKWGDYPRHPFNACTDCRRLRCGRRFRFLHSASNCPRRLAYDPYIPQRSVLIAT